MTDQTRAPTPRAARVSGDRAAADAAAEAERPRLLSAQECWSRLRRLREGRLGYLSGRGPRHVVIPYAVRDRAVVLRLPGYHEAAQYVTGSPVTFDVVERVGSGTAERVRVAGRARLGEPDPGVVEALPDEHWPANLRSWLVWLDVDEVSGESERVSRRTAPAAGDR